MKKQNLFQAYKQHPNPDSNAKLKWMTDNVKTTCKLAKTQFLEGKINSENGCRTLFQLAKKT